jgi:hypothetical protein
MQRSRRRHRSSLARTRSAYNVIFSFADAESYSVAAASFGDRSWWPTTKQHRQRAGQHGGLATSDINLYATEGIGGGDRRDHRQRAVAVARAVRGQCRTAPT